MKRLLILITILLVTLTAFAVPVAAAAPEGDDPPDNRHELAVRAPRVIGIGENAEITVVDRDTGRPVNRAGVWAVAFRQGGNEPLPIADVASAQEDGISLGWTDHDGKVIHVFEKGGASLLIAFKDGHLPGFAWTYVQSAKQLYIRTPQSAAVGEPVTMGIFERNTGTPVAGAGVWALLADEPTIAPSSRDTVAINTETDDLADTAMKRGIFLGRTNNEGRVTHTFEKAGGYYLVAVKDGYAPGYGKIRIVPTTRQLYIRAPQSAIIGEPVTMGVFEWNTGTPVAGAGVWALLTDGFTVAPDREDLADIAMKRGIFLGRTDEKGLVTHKFEKAGGYYLLAIKDGYAPGFGKITIRPSITPKPIPVPQSSVLEPVTSRPQPLVETVKRMVTRWLPAPDSRPNP